MSRFGLLFLSTATSFLFCNAAFAQSAALERLFDDYWTFEMSEAPFSATSSGVEGYNDLVPAVAPEDYARRNARLEAFYSALEALDRADFDAEDKINAALLEFILRHDLRFAEYRTWRRPFLADSGFHSDILYTLGATKFRNTADYEDYLARLEKFPGYLAQNVENMRLGLAEGFAQPKDIMPGVLKSFDALAASDVGSHPLFEPFVSMPQSIPARDVKRLRKQAEKIVRDVVIPAYQETLAFMRDEYAPNAADTPGVSAQTDGAAYYEATIKYYTSLEGVTADQIHETGLKEVDRIRREMEETIKAAGFKGTFEEFQNFLRTDPQFYAETPEQLLKEAAYMAKTADGKLPKFFNKLPRQPYSVDPVPASIAPNYTTGRYISAAPDADRGGQYWVNTYALEERPLYELMALTLHEAVPGHHLQSALALEIENAPTFRTEFYPHAFGEGWGLYSEKLGVEMGVYRTPYENFGRLSYEMWRACRLVIDTGIHSKGWTRQQAIDYLAGNTALSLLNVQTEVDRYISWPGQAVAYKMGELAIWDMRRKAEKELGDKFDIGLFHDAILVNGGLPLDMLRAQVDDYIERERTR